GVSTASGEHVPDNGGALKAIDHLAGDAAIAEQAAERHRNAAFCQSIYSRIGDAPDNAARRIREARAEPGADTSSDSPGDGPRRPVYKPAAGRAIEHVPADATAPAQKLSSAPEGASGAIEAEKCRRAARNLTGKRRKRTGLRGRIEDSRPLIASQIAGEARGCGVGCVHGEVAKVGIGSAAQHRALLPPRKHREVVPTGVERLDGCARVGTVALHER